MCVYFVVCGFCMCVPASRFDSCLCLQSLMCVCGHACLVYKSFSCVSELTEPTDCMEPTLSASLY